MNKFLILGHAQHGKDTVATYLATKKLKTVNASMLWANRVYKALGYDTALDCYNDRVNNRPLWGEMIALFCKDDKARLAKLVYEKFDVYCGCRRQNELNAVIEVFNPIILYVDASNRVELEPPSSYSISAPKQTIWLNNNNGVDELHAQIDTLFRF